MALGGLVRTPARSIALLDAIAAKKVPTQKVTDAHRKALLESTDPAVRTRAMDLFK